MASQHPHVRRIHESKGKAEAHLKNKGSDLFRDTLEEFKERSDDARTIVTEYVKEKPFKALGIAVLAGVGLALLLRR